MLFSWWGLASSSSQSSSSLPQRELDNYRHIVDDDKDDDSLWSRHHHEYNQTIITSTVTIRVTPSQDFLFSWACLSLLLLVSIGVATWQVYKERNIDQRAVSTGGGSSGGSSAIGSNNNNKHGTASDHHHHHHHRLVEESSSTAEVTRCVVSSFDIFCYILSFRIADLSIHTTGKDMRTKSALFFSLTFFVFSIHLSFFLKIVTHSSAVSCYSPC